jgi:hypothetical protein
MLDGYTNRASGAVGVHDELHARAIVVDDGTTQAAIVSCDLLAIDRRLAARVRELAFAATGIPGAHMMVSATHTHAGPTGLRADIERTLMESTARTIAGAVAMAHEGKRPAVLKAGRGSVDTVSQNRRDPDGPIDDALRVLLFDSLDPTREPPVGSIVNFACHATVLFHTNMQISADYPGHAVATVRKVIGDAPALFLNGACGDVNPAWIEQEHVEAHRVGTIVGAEAARRMQELRPLGVRQKAWNIRWDELTDKRVTTGDLIEPRIRVASAQVEVPVRQLDPPAAYDARLRDLRRELESVSATDVESRRRLMEQITQAQGERGFAATIRPGGPHYLRPEVQAIALGEGCVVVGLPGEFFAETGKGIQAAAGVPHLLVACYTNHHVFYVVPKAEFARGGYEPGVAMLDETAEETLRNAAIELIRKVAAR